MDIIASATFWTALARIAIVILTVLLAWITYQSNLILRRIQPDFNLLLSTPELLLRVALVGLCLMLAWLTGLSAAQLGLMITSPVRDIGLGLTVGFGLQLMINLVTYEAIRYFGREIYSPRVILNILPRRSVEWLLVPLALLPAVAMEELLFRSLWLGGFGDIIPMPVLILGTSIVFGVMHLPQGYLGVVGAAVLNVLLALLFLWSGGILAPFVAHYTINLSQVVVAHFQRGRLQNY